MSAFFQASTRYFDIFFGQALDFLKKFAKFLFTARGHFSVYNTNLKSYFEIFGEKIKKIDEEVVIEFSHLAQTLKIYPFSLESNPQRGYRLYVLKMLLFLRITSGKLQENP